MSLPFSAEAFFEIFSIYNLAVFPAQIVIFLLAILCVFMLFFKIRKYSFSIFLILSAFWFWMGFVYQIIFFSRINPASKMFGILFIVQAILFLIQAFRLKSLSTETVPLRQKTIGYSLIFYSLFLYPLINIAMGHGYPAMPTFGLPCPITMFTFGTVFLLGIKKIPVFVLIIPILWTFIGTIAALKLGVPADFMLAVTTIIYLIERLRKSDKPKVHAE